MRVVLVLLLLSACAGAALYQLDSPAPAPEPLFDLEEAEAAAVGLTAAGARPGARDLTDEDPQGQALLSELEGRPPAEQLAVLTSGNHGFTGFHAELARHLAALIASSDLELHTLALGRLMHMGSRAAPFILPLLESEDDHVRSRALYVLYNWRCRGEELPALDYLGLLEDPSENLVNLVLSILGLGAPYEPALAARLRVIAVGGTPIVNRNKPLPVGFQSSGSVGTPVLATDALALMGPEGIRILQALLETEDATQRGMILRSLAQAPADQLEVLLPDLARLLRDPEADVRYSALFVLETLDGRCRSCLLELLLLLEEEDGPVEQVIHVLAEIGPPAEAAVPALIEYLRSPDEHLVDQSAAALGAIRARPAATLAALEKLMLEEGSESGAKAMAAFGRAGYEYALEIFRGDDPDARHAALLVFGRQGEAAAGVVPELLPLLRGEDVFLRERAAFTIAAIGPAAAAAAPVLIESLLRADDPLAPALAGLALQALGPAGEAAIKRALQTKEVAAQRRALHALVRFRGRTAFALDELEAFLESKDDRLRQLALEALLVGLEYPEGFAKTPQGVDDRRLRAVARAELEQVLAQPVVHDSPRRTAQLEALTPASGN